MINHHNKRILQPEYRYVTGTSCILALCEDDDDWKFTQRTSWSPLKRSCAANLVGDYVQM
jgi:hypothetical protein